MEPETDRKQISIGKTVLVVDAPR